MFVGDAGRRAAVRILYKHAGPWLVLFCIVDDHVHVVLYCSRARAGKLKRAILLGLRSRAAPELEPPYMKPVETRSHMNWLLDYLLGQLAHHELPVHPALWSGSCFADLVGARVIDGIQLRLPEVLPRKRSSDIWTMVGLPPKGLAPVPDSRLRELGVDAIAAAAAFAVSCDPALAGRPAWVVDARAATAQLARGAGIQMGDVILGLGIKKQGVYKLLARPIDPMLLRAVRLRLAIDEEVRGLASGER